MILNAVVQTLQTLIDRQIYFPYYPFSPKSFAKATGWHTIYKIGLRQIHIILLVSQHQVPSPLRSPSFIVGNKREQLSRAGCFQCSQKTPHIFNQTKKLARSPDDPQRIRVASVFELFFVCLFVCSLSANFLIFLLLILLFYSTVSSVIGPLPRRSTEDQSGLSF